MGPKWAPGRGMGRGVEGFPFMVSLSGLQCGHAISVFLVFYYCEFPLCYQSGEQSPIRGGG